MTKTLAALLLCFAATTALSQQISVPDTAVADAAALELAIPDLARQALAQAPATDVATRLEYQFRFQLAAGQYEQAAATFDEFQKARPAAPPGQVIDPFMRLELFARSKALEAREKIPYAEAFAKTLERRLSALDNATANAAAWDLGTPPEVVEARLRRQLPPLQGRKTLTFAEVLTLVRWQNLARALESFAPSLDAAFAVDDAKRYSIDRGVRIKTPDGATLTANVVRLKNVPGAQPAVLSFTIYADPFSNLHDLRATANHGYVAIYAYARGKYLSTDEIRPWETEAGDTRAVIDWISRQPWCDGKVGMYGGSYEGFVQWAALKNPHPALKTIVSAGASFPGNGLPMQNNVMLGANYAWPFYVMDNRYLDNEIYNQTDRWSALLPKWYESGRPWRDIDAIDGKPNPLLQRQLQHPSFDSYYQAMQPYEQDYAKINIPILTTTGYFDDANSAAVNYLVDHYRYNKNAEHYLVVGPYRHPGGLSPVKDPVVAGYEIDPAAQFDGMALAYQWFDYVMKGAPKPAMLKDRINYEVMGANVWRHAPSIQKMADTKRTLYLTNAKVGSRYDLSARKPASRGSVSQVIDFADRRTSSNLYPPGAWLDEPDSPTHITYVSEPFAEPVSVDGLITGQLDVTIDRKDFDFTWALYEATPQGKYFKLAYYLGRASYASDMAKRKLLTPGKPASLPFWRTSIVSRQLSKGSRLVLLLTVNKNAFAQVNYGTGKDVSDESIADAGQPLHVQWHNSSFITVPLRKEAAAASPLATRR